LWPPFFGPKTISTDLCLAYTWHIPGVYLSYTWHILGIYWAYTWHILGIYWAYTGHIPGIYWAYTWNILGIYLAYTGQPFVHSLKAIFGDKVERPLRRRSLRKNKLATPKTPTKYSF